MVAREAETHGNFTPFGNRTLEHHIAHYDLLTTFPLVPGVLTGSTGTTMINIT